MMDSHGVEPGPCDDVSPIEVGLAAGTHPRIARSLGNAVGTFRVVVVSGGAMRRPILASLRCS